MPVSTSSKTNFKLTVTYIEKKKLYANSRVLCHIACIFINKQDVYKYIRRLSFNYQSATFFFPLVMSSSTFSDNMRFQK